MQLVRRIALIPLFWGCCTVHSAVGILFGDSEDVITTVAATTVEATTLAATTVEATTVAATTEIPAETTTSFVKLGNPLENTTAMAGNSTKDMLATLPESLQAAIAALKPGGAALKECSAEPKANPARENATCKCPQSKEGESENIDKYKERAGADGSGCDYPQGMWNSDWASATLRAKFENIAKVFNLGPGYRVLDWGAGCGHQIDLIAGEMGFSGVGFDIVEANGAWANLHLNHIDNFCVVDGSGGIGFQNNTFDVVLSNGALHHVMPVEKQCTILNEEVFNVLAPGGCAWFGFLNAWQAPTMNESTMADCFKDNPNVTGTVINEKAFFGYSDYDSDGAYSVVFCKTDAAAAKVTVHGTTTTTTLAPEAETPAPTPVAETPAPTAAALVQHGSRAARHL